MTTNGIKIGHPSQRFQQGEVHDFETAMQVYIEQFREELRINRELYREYAQRNIPEYRSQWREEIEGMRQEITHIEAMVENAQSIYEEVVTEACKRAAAQMRATGDRHLQDIADAVETGDWSRLAI